MLYDKVFAKVILSGEHSVLRGGAAVVAPLKSKSLDYKFEDSQKFEIVYNQKTAPYEILIEGTIEKALKILKKQKADFKIKIFLKSLVPLGKGLGGSAAFCVFVARAMKFIGFLKQESVFSFSVELENMFHGESSGVDVAGCLSSGPHLYIRGEILKELSPNVSNLIFGLKETGESADTEECIQRVLSLKREDKNLFYTLDSNMDWASKSLSKALELGNTKMLTESFENAKSVFEEWDLVTPLMKNLMKDLKDKGALAVKPTGSGLGGYVLSVWSKEDRDKCIDYCSDTFTL